MTNNVMQPGDYISVGSIANEDEMQHIRASVRGMGYRAGGSGGIGRYLVLSRDGDLFFGRHPKGHEWTPEEVLAWQPDTDANPQPGDILDVAQAMRWMANNLDAGRLLGDGLEQQSWATGDWDSGPIVDIPVATYRAERGRLRVALPHPRMVTIDGTEYPVPEPVAGKPEEGALYWFVRRGAVYGYGWADDEGDHALLAAHYFYTSREEAEQALAIHRAIYGGDKG